MGEDLRELNQLFLILALMNVDRVGVKALVLEQSGGLRTEGTSLSLFPNAWRALDALGVADKLRGSFINITGYWLHSHLKVNRPLDPILVEDICYGKIL